MRLLGKWLMLSFVGLVCLSVWGTLVWFVILDDSQQHAKNEDAKTLIEEVDNSTTDPWEMITLHEEKSNSRENFIINIKERGIRREDVTQFAPNGEISIDELLTIVTEKDQQ